MLVVKTYNRAQTTEAKEVNRVTKGEKMLLWTYLIDMRNWKEECHENE